MDREQFLKASKEAKDFAAGFFQDFKAEHGMKDKFISFSVGCPVMQDGLNTLAVGFYSEGDSDNEAHQFAWLVAQMSHLVKMVLEFQPEPAASVELFQRMYADCLHRQLKENGVPPDYFSGMLKEMMEDDE